MQTISRVNSTEVSAITINTWIHMVIVFGAANGLRIYINGQLTTASVSAFQGQKGVSNSQFITLSNNSPFSQSLSISCRNGSIPIAPGPYKGAIDDFRLYNRELDNEEICVLVGL